LHDGHLGLADIATRILGHEAVFELAAVNAGKPSLSEEQCTRRLIQFAGRYGVFVSNAPLFSAKAELYPGATFVIGVDTAQRILQPRYYDASMDNMYAALEQFKLRGCGFLVAGRVDEHGEYRRAVDLAVPDQFSSLFTAIPGDQFRIDISSSSVRKQDSISSAK
jgi:hypothetical protein